jgi:hypothetical protein
MATGSPGSNGVWLYGEDDSEATFSALLNKAGTTVNTQLGADRTRLTSLESRATSLESTRPGTAGKPLQFAAGGVVTGAAGQVTVTLPAGRFGFAPIITATVINHPNVCVVYIDTTSAASFTVGAFTIGGARVVAAVQWHAVQMTAGSAAG